MYFLKTFMVLGAVMFETVLNSTYKVYKRAKQCLIPSCLKTTALNILFEGG